MSSRPPSWPGLLVRALVPTDLAHRIVADLDEEWEQYVRPQQGPLKAWVWYWIMALRSIGATWRMELGTRPAGEERRSVRPNTRASVWDRLRDGGHGVRVATRSLARSPGLSATAVAVMALGISAAAVVFSVFDEVLLRPMSFADPSRVVAVHGTEIGGLDDLGNVSYPNAMDVAGEARGLSGLVAGSWWRPAFTGDGRVQVIQGLTVSWEYFGVLGVNPAVGRFFTPDEEGEGRPRVVVLSHGIWQERYGGDPGVVGQAVSINGQSYEVVGVAPAGFEDPIGQGQAFRVDIWRTPWFEAADWYRSGRSWKAVGRLAPDVALAGLNAELEELMQRLAQTWPEENQGRSMRAVPVQQWVTGNARTTIFALVASVALILLIACANVANLLLARALQRADELAVRVALGASKAQILRRTLLESIVLAVLGGALGVALAHLGVGLVGRLAGNAVPRLADLGVDGRVVLFSGLVALGTGLLFGSVPAVSSSRLSRRRSGRGARRPSRLRQSLVVAEVGMTVVLLFGAGLFLRTFEALHRVELGIDTEGVTAVPLHDAGWIGLAPLDAQAQWTDVLQAVGSLTEVSAVGAIDIVPLGDNRSCDGTSRVDLPPPGPGEGECAEVRVMLPGALAALGIEVVRGRRPATADLGEGPRVAWISESTHAMLWPGGEEPLGTALRVHGEEFVIAGVVRDIRHFGPSEPPRPMLYMLAHQEPWNGIARGLTLVVRGMGVQGAPAEAVRTAVASAAPGVPLGEATSLRALLAGRVTAPRFRLALTGGFALIALAIALVGLAGVLTFSVNRRRREIGVRLALGARSSDIKHMVLGEGLALLARGLLLGLVVAGPVGFLLSRFLYGVAPWDPVSALAVASVLGLGVLVSAYPAAARAAGSRPASALKLE